MRPILLMANASSLTGLYFENQKYFPHERLALATQCKTNHPALDAAQQQLAEYFAEQRAVFELPLALPGTDFQNRVWNALLAIPCGSTQTYGQIAIDLNKPNSARAVGAAIGRNPISVIVPCHRVVGSSGNLTGYAGGTDIKQRLLELEQRVRQNSHDVFSTKRSKLQPT